MEEAFPLIDLLPTPYAVALRLHRAGESDKVIATATAVDESAVSALLSLAEAKLAALVEADTRSGQPSGSVRDST